MILVVDIGNSNIVLGIFEESKMPDKEAKFLWKIHTDQLKTSDEYEVIIRSLFKERGLCLECIEFIFISSVVPALTVTVYTTLSGITKNEPIVFNSEIYDKLPVRVVGSAYNQIGTDLLANATAGFLCFNSECIVVDFGTALTFTMVDKNGTVQGVAIAPGLQTAVKSLFSNTAQLPSVLLEVPKSVLGTDTISAIQSGIVLGYTELVRGMLNRIHLEKGFEAAPVLATGGLAHVFENSENLFSRIDKQLTLKGLACIASTIIK